MVVPGDGGQEGIRVPPPRRHGSRGGARHAVTIVDPEEEAHAHSAAEAGSSHGQTGGEVPVSVSGGGVEINSFGKQIAHHEAVDRKDSGLHDWNERHASQIIDGPHGKHTAVSASVGASGARQEDGGDGAECSHEIGAGHGGEGHEDEIMYYFL